MKRILFFVLIIVLLALGSLLIFGGAGQASLASPSDLPDTYKECNESVRKLSDASNKMICRYQFVIKDNKKMENFCEENGEIKPSGSSNAIICKLKYYNPDSPMPKNFNECMEVLQPDSPSQHGTKGTYCQLTIKPDNNMTPTTKDTFYQKCRAQYDSPKKDVYTGGNKCRIDFFKK